MSDMTEIRERYRRQPAHPGKPLRIAPDDFTVLLNALDNPDETHADRTFALAILTLRADR